MAPPTAVVQSIVKEAVDESSSLPLPNANVNTEDNQNDWNDDFAGASSPPAPSSWTNKSIATVSEPEFFGGGGGGDQRKDDDYDDPFAHLDDTPREVPLPQLGSGDDDDDDKNPPKKENDEEEEFGDFGSAAAAASNDPPTTTTGVHDVVINDEDADEFGDFGSAQQQGNMQVGKRNEDEDDGFGDFGSAGGGDASPKQDQHNIDNRGDEFGEFGSAAQSRGEDDFGEFGYVTQQSRGETRMEVAKPTNNDNNDDDFGDFGSAAQPAAAYPTQQGNDDDDFGDFGSATQPNYGDTRMMDPEKTITSTTTNNNNGNNNNNDEDGFGDFDAAGAAAAPEKSDDGRSVETTATGGGGVLLVEGELTDLPESTNNNNTASKSVSETASDDFDFGISGAIEFDPVATQDDEGTFESRGGVDGMMAGNENTTNNTDFVLPTNGDTLDFHGFSESPDQMNPVPSAFGMDGEDDFGDFGSAAAAEPSQQPSVECETTTNGGEEPSATSGGGAAAAVENEADDFGDFGSVSIQDNPQETAAADQPTRSTETAAAVVTNDHDGDNKNDDFGDFGSAPVETVASPLEASSKAVNNHSTGDDFGDFGSTAQTSTDDKPTEEASSTAPAPSAANVDDADDEDFGDFGSAPGDTNVEAANPISLSSNDAVGTTNASTELGTSNNDDDDDGFGDFGSAAPMSNTTTPDAQDGTSTTRAGDSAMTDTVAVSSAITTTTTAQEDDDFGDFGSADQATSESNQPADPPKQVDGDDDGDFGDFDSAPEKPSNESGVTAGETKSDENNDDDDDDDFGDFGSAAPTTASVAPAASEESETHTQQPQQHAQPRPTATIHIESNLVLKLTKMSFEKMFGHYYITTDNPPPASDKDEGFDGPTMTIDSFLKSSLKEKENATNDDSSQNKMKKELHEFLLQMNRSPAENKNQGVLLYPDQTRNPFVYPAWQGFHKFDPSLDYDQQLESSPQLAQVQGHGRSRNHHQLPEVLDVKLLSPDEEDTPDMASSTSSATTTESHPTTATTPTPAASSNPNAQGTIVQLPPLASKAAAAKSKYHS